MAAAACENGAAISASASGVDLESPKKFMSCIDDGAAARAEEEGTRVRDDDEAREEEAAEAAAAGAAPLCSVPVVLLACMTREVECGVPGERCSSAPAVCARRVLC